METEKQQEELERVYNKSLNPNEVKEIIDYISEEMKGDYQYSQFKSLISIYDLKEIDLEEEIEK